MGMEPRSAEEVSRCITPQPGSDGQIPFSELVEQGVLNKTAPAIFLPSDSGPFERKWDDCSATPYLVSDTCQQVVSYDDPESIAMKAEFVSRMGMLGVNFWELSGDTSSLDLISSVRNVFDWSRV
jgi:chitinase